MPYYPPHAETQKSASIGIVTPPPRPASSLPRLPRAAPPPRRPRWGRRIAVLAICLVLALAVAGLVVESYVLLSSMHTAAGAGLFAPLK